MNMFPKREEDVLFISMDRTLAECSDRLSGAVFQSSHSKDKEKLPGILKQDEERFKRMDKRAMDVIEAVTNAGLKYEEGKGMGDMCQAIRDLRDEEYQKGEQDGYHLGEQAGYRQAALKMYRKGNSPKQIADILDVSGKVVEEWLGLD